jgi:hypothetical protein
VQHAVVVGLKKRDLIAARALGYVKSCIRPAEQTCEIGVDDHVRGDADDRFCHHESLGGVVTGQKSTADIVIMSSCMGGSLRDLTSRRR